MISNNMNMFLLWREIVNNCLITTWTLMETMDFGDNDVSSFDQLWQMYFSSEIVEKESWAKVWGDQEMNGKPLNLPSQLCFDPKAA